MSEEGDDDFLVEALKSGAFLVLKKPLTVDVIMLIHQHVIREKTLKHVKCENKTACDNVATQVQTNLQESRSYGSKGKERGSPRKDDITSYQSSGNHVEWTVELHTKFMSAIQQLGEQSITIIF